MINLHNDKEVIKDNQELFDNYNKFIISDDRKVFFKLCARHSFFLKVKDLNGDIVECGVFKGAGMLSWLKMVDMYQPHSIKKVIGFDIFDSNFVDGLVNDIDRKTMKQVFTRDTQLKHSDISLEGIDSKIKESGFNSGKYELVKGDISKTATEFLNNRPGFRISLLYLDMDLDKPTYDALNAFWDRIVPGGIVIFDEYAYHSWSEADGVDRFTKDKNIKIINTHLFSPTAYIVKE